MRLVSYRRTSGDREGNTSLEDQLRRIKARCEAYDHELVKDFFDKESAETASRRKGLQNALRFILDGKADGLIVYKLDRFARSVVDGIVILAELHENGKQLVCCADPIDTTSPLGEAFFQIAMVFAELERKMTRLRCLNGRDAAAAQHRYALGSAPYGFRADKNELGHKVIVPDPKEQKVIQFMKELRDSGLSFRAVARELDARKIPPPYRRKGGTSSWNNMTVASIIRKERTLENWYEAGCSYNYLRESDRRA